MATPKETSAGDAYYESLKKKSAAAQAERAASGIPESYPRPSTSTAKELEVTRTKVAESTAFSELDEEERKLRAKIREEILTTEPGGLLLADDELDKRIEERLREVAPNQPAYLGSFAGPVVPYAAGFPALPMNLPGPAPTLGTAMSPQTRAPETQAQKELDSPFDDLEFEKSLRGMSDEEKVMERNKYRAFKRAFEKVRELNPDESVASIVADVERQLNELPSAFRGEKGLITQDPARELGIAAQPLARALSEQTTTGQVPRLEPGQLAFLQGMYEAELPQSQAQAREALSRPGAKPIMETRQRPSGERGPGGRPIMESYQVQVGSTDYTSDEIEQIIRDRTAAGTYDARPWWANAEEREKILANPEKYAKGGILFQKEYPTGAVVESPVSWAVRSAMMPINAAAGAIGYAFTEEGIQTAKERDRPELYKGEGIGANVLYNVATGGGFTKEIGDLYKYNANPTVRDYEWLGRAAGLGADVLSLGDLAVFTGGLRGGIAAVETGRLASLAGAGAREAGGAALRAGIRGAGAGYLDAIPGLGKLATRLEPGDLRVVYGAKVADEYKAATRYLEETGKGASHNEAVRVLDDEGLGGTKFRADAAVRPDTLTEADVVKYLGKSNADGLANTRAVSSSVDEVVDASKAVDAKTGELIPRTGDDAARLRKAESTIKPLLQAAAKSDPRIRAAIASAFEGVEKNQKVTAAEIFKKLREAPDGERAAQRFADSIKTVGAFETGVKTMDTALSGIMSKGTPVVFLTDNTIASSRFAENIVDTYKKGDFFKTVVVPIQETRLVPKVSGNNVVNAFEVADDVQRSVIKETVANGRASGAISEADATRIIGDVDNGFIAADDIRRLTYSEIDATAISIQKGTPIRALAETTTPKGLVPGSTRARTAAQEARASELKSALPVWIKRAKNEILNSVAGIDNQISVLQKELIQQSRNKVSAIDRVLRDEYQRISSDPEFARLYGITTDAPVDVKLIALGQGPIGSGGRAVWAEQFLDGLIYGTKKTTFANAVRPEYQYGQSILRNTEKWNALVARVSAMDADTVMRELDSIFDEAKRIVETDVTVAIKDRGGRALSVPKSLSLESLTVAYARVKANGIIAETAARIIPERPIGLGKETRWFLSLPNDQKDMGLKVFYGLVEEEAKAEGILSRLSTDTYNNEGLEKAKQFVDYFINKVGAGLTDQQKNAWKALLGVQFKFGAAPAPGEAATLIDDVLEQVDLMRSAGMIENFRTEDFLERLGQLVSKKISPDKFVFPAVAEEIARQVGNEAKYKQLVTELSRESDLATDGNRSAIRVMTTVRNLIDSFNAFYYHLMLSASPRFHGVNNLTAPLISYYTTGNATLRIGEAANVMLLGASSAGQKSLGLGARGAGGLIERNAVVLTDRFGVNYTRGQLFDLAVKNGIFKSQINTEIAGSFIKDANAIIGNLSDIEKGRRALFTPWRTFLGDPLAAYTDNVWRMASVMSEVRNGKTIEQALDAGRRSLFDYGDLTEAERIASRNFFVFYNYFRQSVVQAVENLFTAPGRMIRLYRLAQQPSRILIGDQNFEDLSFYFPQDAATGRMVSALEPAEKAKDGVFVQYPMLPHADALKIGAAVITDPVAFMIGPVPIGEDGRRAYSESFIAARLGPLIKAGGALWFSDRPAENLLEIKMKKNRIAPEHVAMWDAIGLKDRMLGYFNAKLVPVEGNAENAYQGNSFQLSEEDYARYLFWLSVAQTTGTIRSWNDWSKIVGGAELTGAYPKTGWEQLQSATGLKSYSSAVLEYVTSERYLRDRARMTSGKTSDIKKSMEERRRP